MSDDTRPDQPQTGPFLDRLFSFHLPDGRLVVVRSFIVQPTNLGILEGGLFPSVNALKREQFVERARANLGNPVVVVEPSITPLPELSRPGRVRERLPWMACAARLVSKPIDPNLCESELTLVWFQDAFDAPLPAEIERAASGVAWAAEAKDYDLP
jgi:hypothetical protein